TDDHDGERTEGEESRGRRNRMQRLSVRMHAMKEVARHPIHIQPEKIANLSARDQDGDAVGETDDDGAGEVLYGRAHSGDPEDQEEHASHHRDGEQAFKSELSDDAGNDDNESAGWTSDLCFRTAQRRDQKAGHDRAIEAGLGSNS